MHGTLFFKTTGYPPRIEGVGEVLDPLGCINRVQRLPSNAAGLVPVIREDFQ